MVPAVLVLVLALVTPVLATEAVPVGAEFKISTHGTNYQYSQDGYAITPRIATAPNGDFVVVWQNLYDHAGGSGYEVLARRFDHTGTPRGGDFTVSPSADLSHPNVGLDAAGNFVVTWQSYTPGSIGKLWFQRYDANGAALGAAQAANVTEVLADAQNPSGLVVHPDGSFVVAWETIEGGHPFESDDIRARRFDASGAPLGDEFVVNTITAGCQSYPSMAADGNGNFLVVWQREVAQPVAGRWFDASGTPLTDEFVALDYDSGELPASVGCGATGTCMTVSGAEAFAQVTDPAGAGVGPMFRVTGDPDYGSVAADPDGNFIVVFRGGVNAEQLYGQRFDSTGQPLGSQFQVTTQTMETLRGPTMPAVAADPSGDFVVVWANNNYDYAHSHDNYGVWGRRFAVCGNGRLTPGIPCDDGNTAAGDGCSAGCDVETCFGCTGEPSSCTQIGGCDASCSVAYQVADTALATFSHLLAPAGDEGLTLKGTIVNSALAPGAYNPAVEGAEVAITSAGLVFGLAAPTAVPPGLPGSGCGPLDGWKASHTNYTYKNLTDALPPACTPGSARGLRGMKIKDRLARDGTIQFEVKLKAATLPALPQASLTATVVLGQSPAAGAAGRCARVIFPKWSFRGSRARFSLI